MWRERLKLNKRGGGGEGIGPYLTIADGEKKIEIIRLAKM